MSDNTADSKLAADLRLSESPEWADRVRAIDGLVAAVDSPQARARLEAMLHDAGDVGVQVAAADALTRFGGWRGLLAVLSELGRRDDSDVDYIGYRLSELEESGEFAVLDAAAAVDPSQMSPEAVQGLQDLKKLIGL
ncbi:HEAT repeat domain-containing protein [Nocardia sp. NPDC052001]|uniref:HEAT repeat domain-containing protein n=1 Tax=Nocardia sp. NPDC052001 TaxID=3154853 RepID=UPI00343B7956